jgi:hypothetical protein
MAYKKIILRRDTAANWTSANPTLSGGEVGIETDTLKMKLGNGSTAWNSLSYYAVPSIDDVGDVTITSASSGQFLKWNGSAWVNDAVDLGSDTTGSYVSSLVAGTGVSLSNNSGENATPTVAIGQSVATDASVSFATVTTTGNVTVGGDLTVSGTTTTLNTETLTINDNIIVLNNNATGAPTENAGIEVERGSSANVAIRWNETTDKWESTTDGSTYVDISDHGSLSGLADDDHTQYLTSARHDVLDHTTVMGTVQLTDINDVNTSATPANNSFLRYNEGAWVDTAITLGTNTSGNYVESLTAGTGVTLTNGTASEGGTPTVAIGQDVSTGTAPTFAGLNLTGNIVFEGATANEFETTIAVTDPTADRTVTLPDASGTVALTADLSSYAPLASPTFTGTVTLPTGTVTSAMILDGTIVNGDINESAGIALSKLATSTAGNIIVYNSSGVPTAVAETGDVTISDTGVTAIASGVIVDADVNASAAIAHSKLANATAGQVLLGTTTTGVVTATTISGDITIDGAGVASIAANAVALGTDTTGDYVASLVAGTGVTLTNNSGETSTPTIAIGQAVATNSNVTFNDLTVSGNLTVSGTTTSINTATLNVADNIVVLNNDVTGSPTENAGIEVERGTSDNVLVRWNETNDKWEATNDGTTYGNLVTTADSGTVTSTMIADGTIVNADINASAAIALSKLATSTAGNIIVYNSSGVPTSVTETGDVTISDTGVTAIASGVIVNADVSASAAIDLGKLADVSTSAQTASYTLVLADKNKIVEMSVGSANNLTVPANASVAFPIGSQINILQTGSGQTTIVAAGGVTINATPGLKMRAQWSYATLVKRAENTWVLVGDISA